MRDILEHYNHLNKLKKSGKDLVGCCPIHRGKGLSVNLEKNCWNCFGSCQAGGNILDFVAKMENVDVLQAGLMIQEWFGITTGSQNSQNSHFKGYKRPKRGEDIVKHLKEEKGPEKGKNGPEKVKKQRVVNIPLTRDPFLKLSGDYRFYLKRRGLKPETIEYFGIGYYSGRGFLKGRICIPIHNKKGELVAYAGRVIDDKTISEENPKYKLPPDFHKSLEVFNLHRAFEYATQGLILVEGFFSVFRIHQAGFPNVVSLMGSSMSEEQEKLIVSAVGTQGKVLLLFDGDESGKKCTKEIAKRLVDKVYVKVVWLKDGLQPDKLKDEEIKKILE
jgi:DNA primase